MRIAILGTDNVGRALGAGCERLGHTVSYGTRDVAAAAARFTAGPVSLLSPAEAVRAADLVMLAVPHAAALTLAAELSDWGGRILVDATNPIAPGLAGLSVGTDDSGAEAIARAARGARVVKAFNTTGWENMRDPRIADGRVCMPVCGDDAEARGAVLALAAALDFDALDCGDLKAARYLEPFAMTWIHLAFKCGLGRGFGFAVLRR